MEFLLENICNMPNFEATTSCFSHLKWNKKRKGMWRNFIPSHNGRHDCCSSLLIWWEEFEKIEQEKKKWEKHDLCALSNWVKLGEIRPWKANTIFLENLKSEKTDNKKRLKTDLKFNLRRVKEGSKGENTISKVSPEKQPQAKSLLPVKTNKIQSVPRQKTISRKKVDWS